MKIKLLWRHRREGASLVETMAGFVLIVPIGLVAIDVVAMVASSQSNEQWAETAARAASMKHNEQEAIEAAQNAVGQCVIQGVVKKIVVSDVEFDISRQQVTVATTMEIKLPVPIPFCSDFIEFRAQSIQPIVSTPAPE